ncbi:MAG: CDP-alcohol phosphatidyltransferase family protein [Flavobacterium sp.]|nr:CDP-alcohol phosphatidyltransferase family protein [Flavobacterium sp.]
MKKRIPYLLLLFRLVLGPFMIAYTYQYGTSVRAALVVMIVLGLLSDIFDGIIARKVGVSSEKLRRLDSQIDVVFWLCVGWCGWILNPEIVIENKYLILLVFVMEALTYVFSFVRFGKETSAHALLSKLWGLTLLSVFVSVIGFGYAGIPFFICIIVGIIAHIDVYLIIFFLPKWTHDVPSSWHAWQLRKGNVIAKNKWFNG